MTSALNDHRLIRTTPA